MKSPGLLAGYGYQKDENEPIAINSSKKKNQVSLNQPNKTPFNKSKKGEKRSFDQELSTTKSEPKEKHENSRAIGTDHSTEHISLTPVEKKPRLSGPSPSGKKRFRDGNSKQSQQSFSRGKQACPKTNGNKFGADKPAWKKKKHQFNKPKDTSLTKHMVTIIAIHKKRRTEMENCTLLVKQGGLDVDGWKKLHPDVVTARASKKNKIVWLNFPSESARNKAYKTILSNKLKNDEMVVDYCGEKSKNIKRDSEEDIDSASLNPKTLRLFGVPNNATVEDLLTLFPKASCIKIKTDFIKNPPTVIVDFVKDSAAYEAFLQADNLKIQGAQIFVFYALLHGGLQSTSNLDDDEETLVQEETPRLVVESPVKGKKAKKSQSSSKSGNSKEFVQKSGLAKREKIEEDESDEDSKEEGDGDFHSEGKNPEDRLDSSSSDEGTKKVGQGDSDSGSSQESDGEE